MKKIISASVALLLLLQLPTFAYADHHDWGYRCDTCGTVRDIERVTTRERHHHLGAGTAIGAIAGGVLGSTVGKGNGRTAATVGGALAGGAIGHEVEEHDRDDHGRYVAWRYRIKMDDGEWVSVTRGHRLNLREGDRVRVEGDDLELL